MPRPRIDSSRTTGFERTFERHLLAQQRKAVLDALASKIDPDATVGEVLDAAEALGWSDGMGGLSLADLADALLSEGGADDDTEATDDLAAEAREVDDEDDEEVVEFDEQQPRARTSKKKGGKKQAAKKKAAKKAAKKTAAKRKSAKKATAKTSTKKATAKKVGKKGAKKSDKKASAARLRALRRKIDADEPMSLDEAAEVFLPMVDQFTNATMQDLEEASGIGRRKLRFHIGQLVRHGYLERHGMGRGTYYTAP